MLCDKQSIMCSQKNKQYGLINMKKPKTSSLLPLQKKLAIFDESDEEDTPHSSINQKLQREAVKTKMRKQTKMEIQKAMEEDPTVFEYDSIYDDMEHKKLEKERMVKSKQRDSKPKYIGGLLKAANQRKMERERQKERKIQQEREQEGDEFGDKEQFVTASYKKKMQELAEDEERERREAERDGDVTKGLDMAGFYRHILDQTTGDGDKEDKKNSDLKREQRDAPEGGTDSLRDNRKERGPHSSEERHVQERMREGHSDEGEVYSRINNEGDRGHERHRGHDRDRGHKGNGREREKDKDSGSHREKVRDYHKEKDSIKDRDRRRDRDTDKDSDRDKDMGKDRDKGKDRGKYGDRKEDRDSRRDKEKDYRENQDRGKDRGNEMERKRQDRSHDMSHDKQHGHDGSKDGDSKGGHAGSSESKMGEGSRENKEIESREKRTMDSGDEESGGVRKEDGEHEEVNIDADSDLDISEESEESDAGEREEEREREKAQEVDKVTKSEKDVKPVSKYARRTTTDTVMSARERYMARKIQRDSEKVHVTVEEDD